MRAATDDCVQNEVTGIPTQNGTRETMSSAENGANRTGAATALAYMQVLRLDHWFKNVFTVIGAIACIVYLDTGVTSRAVGLIALGTFLSCLISSVNYAVNEFLDAAFDAAHPIKRHRPVPSGRVHVQAVFLLGGILLVAALATAVLVFNKAFVLALLLFLLFGLFYNVEPIRAKEVPFADVIVESVNNPLRLLIGWFSVTATGQFPPVSLVILFWAFGAFLMTAKRVAELRFLGARANEYRVTYHYYSEKSLVTAMFGYAAASVSLLAWFAAQYKAGLFWSLPLAAIFMAWYIKLTYEDDSIVKEPERLFKKPFFLLYSLVCLCVLIAVIVR